MQVNEPFPKKTLEEAKASYKDAATEFRSFMSSIQHKNRGLNRKVEAKVRNYDGWKTTARFGEVVIGGAGIVAGYVYGPWYYILAPLVPAWIIETKIGDYGDELKRFRSKADDIMEESKKIEKDINVGIKLLANEIYLIGKGWCQILK